MSNNEKYNYKKLSPFKWFVLENFPFIEADFDAITSYQLYCKVVEYLNKTINSMNETGEAVEEFTQKFIDLQNYVDNYFDNLDVQDEIDNKLDEMVTDGTFDTIINDKLFANINNEIDNNKQIAETNLTNAVNQINQELAKKRSINQLIQMGDLSQEVKMAITGGSVAVVGNNAVQNINIVNGANDRRTTDFVERVSENLFNGNLKSGYYDVSGNYHNSESYVHTDFIPVKYLDFISWLLRSQNSSGSGGIVKYPYAKLYANIRFVSWFDSNFNPIVGNGYDNVNYTRNESVQAVDENVAYCIITVSSTLFGGKNNDERIMILNTSSAINTLDEIPYNTYKDNLKNTFYPNETQIDSINNLIDMKLQNTIFNSNSNVFNPNANEVGFIRPNGLSNNSSYVHTPKISIKTGQYLSFRGKNSSNDFSTLTPMRLIMFYDIKGNNVQFYDNESNVAEVCQATSPDIAYAIVSVNAKYNSNNYMLQVTDTDTTSQEITFEPFSTKINVPYINENSLLNKIMVNFGDSIAAGANGSSYGQQIANSNQMQYTNYAVGGATIADTNSEERTSILTQVNTFIATEIIPDFILINGGTNDILYNELGEITDVYSETSSIKWNTETTAGALEKIFYLLKTNKPSSKILYVIPHRMNTRNNNSQNEWFSLIKQICKKWSVPVASIFDEGNLNTNIEAMRTYTDAGTHPTYEGYTKFYVPIVESKLYEIN